MEAAPAVDSPTTSSPASLSSMNEVRASTKATGWEQEAGNSAGDVNQDEYEKRVGTAGKKKGDNERRAAKSSLESSAAASSSAESDNGNSSPSRGGGWSALGMMKDRATMAKNQLAPQLLSMKQRTSKRLGRYQPSIDKVRSSASAAATLGRERVAPALSLVKDGSTQGWSMLKTKLASAAPVAEKIQTMGLQVMTDMMSEAPIEVMFVDNPAEANCRFLREYKAPLPASGGSKASLGLLRLSRAISSASTSSLSSLSRAESMASNSEPSSAQQCFSKSYVLGTILVFCGDVQTLGRVASVNRACHKFISTERRLWKFCVRYGEMSEGTRFGFWEKIASIRRIRESSEFDFDVYLQMALSKGDSTELILTDVRRTYGRVAPHKRAPNDREEVVEDTEEALINQLSEILHALAGRFPDVGYCQGMDYIAAHVLDHVKKYNEAKSAARQAVNPRGFTRVQVGDDDEDDEEEEAPSPTRTSASAATRVEVETAFWMLVGLFENYGLRQMFSPGLDRLHQYCFQCQRLFEIGMPALAEHFEEEKVMVEMFIVGWFQTLFLYLNVLPRESLDRIWDIFLFENNWKIMLRVALALLQLSEEHIIGKRIDDVMQFLNTFPDKWDEILAPELLIEHALAIKVTNGVLSKLQKQYAKQKRSSPLRR